MITNPEILENKFKCGKILADYLERHHVPLLSRKDGKFYFSKTKILEEELKNVPIWIKIIERIF